MEKVMVFLCVILLTGCTFRGDTPEIEVVGQGYFDHHGFVKIESKCYHLEDLFSDRSFGFETHWLKRGEFDFSWRHRGDLVTVFTIKDEPGYHGIVGNMSSEEIIATIKDDDGLIISIIVVMVCAILFAFGVDYKEKFVPKN